MNGLAFLVTKSLLAGLVILDAAVHESDCLIHRRLGKGRGPIRGCATDTFVVQYRWNDG